MDDSLETTNNLAPELYLDLVISEYEYQRARKQKLEAKIGVTFAFLGLFAPNITKYFEWSKIVEINTHILIKVLIFLWWLLIILSYVLTLWQMIHLLKTVELHYFNSKYKKNRENLDKPQNEAINNLIKVYERYITYNHTLNNTQADSYTDAINTFKTCFSLVFLYEILVYIFDFFAFVLCELI